MTPYLLQRRRPRCHVKAALAWAGEGVGGQLLALSWKWSTGPAEFQRHKSPHRQVLGHRHPPGLFITYWKCHSWESWGQSCTSLPRLLPEQHVLHTGDLLQPPDGSQVECSSHISPHAVSHGARWASGSRLWSPCSSWPCLGNLAQLCRHGNLAPAWSQGLNQGQGI